MNSQSRFLVEVLNDVLQDIVQEEVQQEEVQESSMAPMMAWVPIQAWVAMMEVEVEEDDFLLAVATAWRSLELVQVQFRHDVAFQVEAVGQEDLEKPFQLVLLTQCQSHSRC